MKGLQEEFLDPLMCNPLNWLFNLWLGLIRQTPATHQLIPGDSFLAGGNALNLKSIQSGSVKADIIQITMKRLIAMGSNQHRPSTLGAKLPSHRLAPNLLAIQVETNLFTIDRSRNMMPLPIAKYFGIHCSSKFLILSRNPRTHPEPPGFPSPANRQ